MKSLFRFAHISDLHFSRLTWNPAQFFSKRWLGNLNLFLSRRHRFSAEYLSSLPSLLKELHVDAVIITGDLTSTSHESEFSQAKQFIESLGQKVYLLPGNHDQYTKGAYKKQLFYQFFDPLYSETSPLNLKEDGLSLIEFAKGWWLIGLDTAIATSLLSSNGYFSPELEIKLESALQQIPSNHNVVLVNHFPIFSNESSRKSLLRKEALKAVIERHPQIKLFLHGHTHRHCIANLQNSGLPIIVDSGSIAQNESGSWNLIDITPHGCEIEAYKIQNGSWHPSQKSHFQWKTDESLV